MNQPTRITFLCHDALEGRRPTDAHLLRLILAECVEWFDAEGKARERAANVASANMRRAAARAEEID